MLILLLVLLMMMLWAPMTVCVAIVHCKNTPALLLLLIDRRRSIAELVIDLLVNCDNLG